MKLGLLSAILSDCDFRQVVDVCCEIGYEAVEVACWPKQQVSRRYAGVTHLDFDALSTQALDVELQYAKNKGIQISALAYYPNPLSPIQDESQSAVAHIHKLIDAAKTTGIGLVNTFIGRDRFKTVEENLLLYKEIWSPIIEHAECANVRIGIENCPMLFSRDEWPGGNNIACTPALWKELFQIIDSDKLGLNYDPSHCVILDIDYLKPIYEFREKLFHVHLKDTHIFKDKLDCAGRMAYPLEFMAPKLPGLGDINWAAFCSALYDVGYSGVACVEAEDRNFELNDQTIRKGLKLAYQNVCRYF